MVPPLYWIKPAQLSEGQAGTTGGTAVDENGDDNEDPVAEHIDSGYSADHFRMVQKLKEKRKSGPFAPECFRDQFASSP